MGNDYLLDCNCELVNCNNFTANELPDVHLLVKSCEERQMRWVQWVALTSDAKVLPRHFCAMHKTVWSLSASQVLTMIMLMLFFATLQMHTANASTQQRHRSMQMLAVPQIRPIFSTNFFGPFRCPHCANNHLVPTNQFANIIIKLVIINNSSYRQRSVIYNLSPFITTINAIEM